MSNVINGEDRFRILGDGGEDGADHFLVNEGLELLATYRSITNRGVRLAVKDLVKQMARAAKEAEGRSGA